MTDIGYTESTTRDAEFGDYFALLKPRVMSLVIFTATVGLVVAPGSIHPFLAFATLLILLVVPAFLCIYENARITLESWFRPRLETS